MNIIMLRVINRLASRHIKLTSIPCNFKLKAIVKIVNLIQSHGYSKQYN
jgi:hypothetical protein